MDLLDFISENKKVGGLSKDISDKVESLWNKYKLDTLQDGCSIITAEFGKLGSLEIKEVESFEKPITFKYESGSDFISITSKSSQNILWTDYRNIEPYNRQGGLYSNGCSFKMLGSPVLEKEDYREFNCKHDYKSNVSFGVWGFRYNTYYETITFGICLKTEDVDKFILELRNIIGK
jgi:hypothetical protein